ncbi:MAG: response regulator [Betaproteobacteria bacterium]|nr:response regulator [Betaproteobacteria bacterium]
MVDDSPSIVMSIRGFLSSQGHRVVAAEDGESALRIVRAARPDLVLMDVVMPEPDGIEITRRFRAEAAGNWFPIILMSSLDGANDVVRGLSTRGGRLPDEARPSGSVEREDHVVPAHHHHAAGIGDPGERAAATAGRASLRA